MGARPSAPQPRTKAVLLFLFFFCVIAAFWSIKPLRTSSVVQSFGPDLYPLFKQGVVVIAPVLVAAISWASSRFARETIIYLFAGVFGVSAALFWMSFAAGGGRTTDMLFYFFVDSYITVMVTLFWAYLNDVYSTEDARRYYGPIGLGGLTGGIVGAWIAGWAGTALGYNVIVAFGVFLAAVFPIVAALGRMCDGRPRGPVVPAHHEDRRTQLTEGATTVFRSRYLLAVLGVVGMYEIVSTIVDYAFNASLHDALGDRVTMAAYQGRVFFVAQLAALAVQGALTPFVHRRFGVIPGLLFLPLCLFTGMTGALFVPGLVVFTLTIGAEASLAYSINQSSKEILYVPLDALAKYKGKAFIDIFGIRAEKALGAAVVLAYTLWLRESGVHSSVLTAAALVLICVWFYALRVISKEFAEKTAAEDTALTRAA